MIYWVTTALVSGFLVISSAAYVLHKPTIEGIRVLGLPDYLRIEFAVLKLLAAFILIVPHVPTQPKEWAYAGAALFFVTSIVAHVAHGDPWIYNLVNLALLLLLFISNIYLVR